MNPYVILAAIGVLLASCAGSFVFGRHVAGLECAAKINAALDDADAQAGKTEGERDDAATRGSNRSERLQVVIADARAQLARLPADTAPCPAWLPADRVPVLDAAIEAANRAGLGGGNDADAADADAAAQR